MVKTAVSSKGPPVINTSLLAAQYDPDKVAGQAGVAATPPPTLTMASRFSEMPMDRTAIGRLGGMYPFVIVRIAMLHTLFDAARDTTIVVLGKVVAAADSVVLSQ